MLKKLKFLRKTCCVCNPFCSVLAVGLPVGPPRQAKRWSGWHYQALNSLTSRRLLALGLHSKTSLLLSHTYWISSLIVSSFYIKFPSHLLIYMLSSHSKIAVWCPYNIRSIASLKTSKILIFEISRFSIPDSRFCNIRFLSGLQWLRIFLWEILKENPQPM